MSTQARPEDRLRALAARWADATPAERANAQMYLTELCDALGVERPRPAGAGYQFEAPVRVVTRDGTETVNFIDLYKPGCFILEAKDTEPGTPSEILLRKAFGQASTYAAHVAESAPPPYLLVLDVATRLLVWDRWSGTYGGYNALRRIDLTTLAERPADIEYLRTLWEEPRLLDPRRRAAQVTEEIAAELAELAARLEARGHDQETVARFLIRCVFTMFSEDHGLLPGEPFHALIRDVAFQRPSEFVEAVEDLWAAMDSGRRYGPHRLLRFNGHFFTDAKALELTREDLVVLERAARSDWRHVEPTIFGTLLVRALDPKERHQLGAEYTPRAYVERLVRPTIEEPVRERWTLVQAEVLQLAHRGAAPRAEAVEKLRAFHRWLCSLRVLDSAAGSGNFLFVALHTLKRIEFEVVDAIEELTGQTEQVLQEVSPAQFYGIEIKPWAREITELTLWIGYHSVWLEHYGHRAPREPLLTDTGTLDCRDAILEYDKPAYSDPARGRPDPTPRLRHPVTGKLVPDPAARLLYHVYPHPRPAPWPEADFIIGNPPYMGQARQRAEFGDGYVDALREAYPEVPETADYVLYWWARAAEAVASGRTLRAGLITTNSITQAQNRAVIAAAATKGVRVAWAIPDHPWTDEVGGADVRVAMTVLAKEPPQAVLVRVDEGGVAQRPVVVPALNDDLSAHADVATAAAEPLRANDGLAAPGFKLHGAGFILDRAEAEHLLALDPRQCELVRPFRNGMDIAKRPRGVWVIDFGTRDEAEAQTTPLLYNIVRDRVKPERDANRDRSTREKWWRFGRNREELREALVGLPRYIVTPETARHRYFVFLDARMAPDNTLVCVASADAFHLGVLSSSIHVAWAYAAGGRLGVGNDPRYNKGVCFDAFPFPTPAPGLRQAIGEVAERLDQHRWAVLARSDAVTLSGMYGVLEKLRANEPLTARERRVHEDAACGVLLQLHEQLDLLVAQAYGWAWPLDAEAVLERLVALHDERIAQEARGQVDWLRPAYQRPRAGDYIISIESAEGAITPTAQPAPGAGVAGSNGRRAGAAAADLTRGKRTRKDGTRAVARLAWPTSAVDQIAALQASLAAAPATVEEAAGRFLGARRELVARHVETLEILGELQRKEDGRFIAAERRLVPVR
ncbi:MAG TPA: DNA methyltransferase [Gemmatimonadales bacterium]|nr:DNA methyltransferase [Gemmatimonadales bacterium]